jgi:hypothetical protein
MSNVAIVQQILDGPWQHASAARQACRDQTWAAFVQKTAPARPALFGRRDHARCVALAASAPTSPVMASMELVPLWGCVTYESPADEWVAVHGVRWEGRTLDLQEASPFFEHASPRADVLCECKVQRRKAGVVVTSDSYASNIPMRLKAGAFAVLELDISEVLSVAGRDSAPVARPLLEVPIFSRRFLPRVAVTAELERAIDALGYTASLEGD